MRSTHTVADEGAESTNYRRATSRTLALAFALLIAPAVSTVIDAIMDMIAPRVPAAIGNLGLVSPAWAQPAALTPSQSEALSAYDKAVNDFKSILRTRRAQIDSNQALPNLPGQALYLARNAILSAYKDLTDALPAKIGRPNKFGIPPAYFDAANEPLLEEYAHIFKVMQVTPAKPPNSTTPFADVVELATAIARAKGLDASQA